MADYFVSDLHLGPQQPHLTALFVRFLNSRAREAKRLFILGDLFEYWLGDDAIHPHYQPVLNALKALSSSGVEVLFMRGNRDFLVGQQFAELTGATLLDDPCVFEVAGEATLLSHGDIFCSDDTTYQQFRALVRSPQWQADFLSKSIEERMQVAEQARNASREATQEKSDAIMDVNLQDVSECMQKHQVSRLIHGHTHRPAQHTLEIDGQRCQRIVLADWGDHGHLLICDEQCTTETLN